MSKQDTRGPPEQHHRVKTIRVSEDGPGAYTLMFIRVIGDGHEPLDRSGYSGVHVMAHIVDSEPRGVYYDPIKMLNEEGFTNKGSEIDGFIKSMLWKVGNFEKIEDGAKYEAHELEEVLNGSG